MPWGTKAKEIQQKYYEERNKPDAAIFDPDEDIYELCDESKVTKVTTDKSEFESMFG